MSKSVKVSVIFFPNLALKLSTASNLSYEILFLNKYLK